MQNMMRKADLVAYYDGVAAVAKKFDPPLSRQAVYKWGEFVPVERVQQLLAANAELSVLLVDPETGRTKIDVLGERLAGRERPR